EPGLLALPEDFEGGGQLHGVIGTQRVCIRQPHGIAEQSGRDLDDGVATGKMLAEAVENRRCLREGERPAFPAAGDGGGDLDGGNAGQIDRVAGAAPRQAAHPACSVLLNITLDQGARIDEIPGHYRRSRIMVSDNGSPLMVTGASSGSSSISRAGSGSEVMRPMLSRC